MDAELRSLEEKTAHLLALCQHLRADNTQLRQELAACLARRKELSHKVAVARTRLEQLVSQIPEGKV